jgi:hypothetical protein
MKYSCDGSSGSKQQWMRIHVRIANVRSVLRLAGYNKLPFFATGTGTTLTAKNAGGNENCFNLNANYEPSNSKLKIAALRSYLIAGFRTVPSEQSGMPGRFYS